MIQKNINSIIFIGIILSVVIGYFYFNGIKQPPISDTFAYGNGRIEASEVSITAKIPGRLVEVYVNEGDIVQKGQMLAKLDTQELDAKLKVAIAGIEQARQNKNYLKALLEQRQTELDLAKENYLRAEKLYKSKSISLLQYQQDETAYKSLQASIKAAQANIAQSEAIINGAISEVEAIKVNIDDSTLYAPITGRVLYKLAQNGEVIGSGQKVLVILDLLDTYMTIFVPTSEAGVIGYGSEARIVLDAFPDISIPANITFVSPKAQFTPKQIETQDEREKLMFRVKATIDYELLKEYMNDVKTGLPGVTYIRLDENTPWPEHLNKLPKSYKK
ncbi:MAG: HlyD family efflux transporter periplasmic adaptor subunit [Arcobacteraceae bacterium]|nr:HlyD family efflux transporter periplasmic adaptor subunit [Arcobacteraceae bacterium]MDY0326777.1 HlyD family efflux transporter periplasmic adaptor subunit [Arcobacteraceae bacterium]